MTLKKDGNSLGSEQEKSDKEDSSLLELKNLDNKKQIESQNARSLLSNWKR